jgi:hypothetical protein
MDWEADEVRDSEDELWLPLSKPLQENAASETVLFEIHAQDAAPAYNFAVSDASPSTFQRSPSPDELVCYIAILPEL